MVLFILRKLILQTRMRSHPVALEVWYLLPYFMYANSKGSGETAQMCRLTLAFAARLCDKYHNLMSWLNFDAVWVNIKGIYSTVACKVHDYSFIALSCHYLCEAGDILWPVTSFNVLFIGVGTGGGGGGGHNNFEMHCGPPTCPRPPSTPPPPPQ